MHILIATDAQWIVDDVVAALGDDDTTFTVCRDGRVVAGQVAERTPDLGIFDLQIGSMGGMAVTMSLRLDESGGLLPRVPVLMLLDRRADLHLARRSAADGWLIKPLDALRLQQAANAIIAGGSYTEGLDDEMPPVDLMVDLGTGVRDGDGDGDGDGVGDGAVDGLGDGRAAGADETPESAEGEPVAAG